MSVVKHIPFRKVIGLQPLNDEQSGLLLVCGHIAVMKSPVATTMWLGGYEVVTLPCYKCELQEGERS